MKKSRKIAIGAAVIILGLVGASAIVVFSLQKKVTARLHSGQILPPLEVYTQGITVRVGRKIPLNELERELSRRSLQNGRDFVLGSIEECLRVTPVTLQSPAAGCLWLREPTQTLITWDQAHWIQEVWVGHPLASVVETFIFPRLITSFLAGQPLLQQNVELSEVPLSCLQAVTAIEDHDFLQHRGVSPSGILRALWRNLRAGRFKEGGSTITQQLVKNFFLTPQKTLRRKIEEQALALLLESQLTKDEILEMYLNVIYMGQSGPYQVRGLASAAQAYFDQPLTQLSLAQCAMLAALINSPGRYSPLEHPLPARARRELVLRKMNEAQMISETDWQTATAAPLAPATVSRNGDSHTPYFVLTALKELESLNLDLENGARIYTSLDGQIQSQIADAVSGTLPQIERRVKKPSKQPLQVVVLTVNPETAEVVALIGGRNFKLTQFNRATNSRRQIGSIVKPFVFWSALKEHNPLSVVMDEPFEWKWHDQVWRPKNYEPGHIGAMPYVYALANSVNIPAARIGQEVTLPEIADTLRRAGITAPINEVPALTLGALELSPLMVAQAYTTLARLGQYAPLHTIQRVEDGSGQLLFLNQNVEGPGGLAPLPTSVLLGMMKQAFTIGTAKAARLSGYYGPAAGKTGTTSDTRDAWFAGFTPQLLTVVWVGYDDNTPMGLTGAGAALPIWIEIMRRLDTLVQPQDWQWPTGVEVRSIPKEQLQKQFPNLKDLSQDLVLVLPDWAS